MAKFVPHICGSSKVHIPDTGCTDCEELRSRVEAIEAILEKKISISQLDRSGGSIEVEVLGEVIE